MVHFTTEVMRRPKYHYLLVVFALLCTVYFLFTNRLLSTGTRIKFHVRLSLNLGIVDSGTDQFDIARTIYSRLIFRRYRQSLESQSHLFRPSNQAWPTEKQVMRPIPHGNVNENSAFIFIGGVPRSGTTLMRAMLDAHPDVRCGEETRIIPRILGLRAQWKKSEKEWNRLQQAGVTNEVIKSAIGSFIIQVIAGHGAPAPRLCNKDPFTMKSAAFLSEMFPNAQYIFMIRDGRATVHSIISRKVTITGFDLNDYRQCMVKWNAAITAMNEQCEMVGEKCLKVYYEQLVLHPESQMRRILNFLNLPWNSSVLHHEQYIGKDISLSNVERSSDQVVKPINIDALTKWVGTFPEDVVKDMDFIAPMLRQLGYDPEANPPVYGIPDDVVAKKTEEIHKNGQEWYKRAVSVVNDPERVDKPPES